MTIELSRRRLRIETGSFGLQSVSSSAARSQDGTIIRMGLVAPKTGPDAGYGDFALRDAQIAAKEINAARRVHRRKRGRDQARLGSHRALVQRAALKAKPAGLGDPCPDNR